MTATRRLAWNYALDRAIEVAKEMGKPLVVLEALSVRYPWASDRFHRAILDGMVEHERALSSTPIVYFPYVEPNARAGDGLLHTLAESAAWVVTDDAPVFFTPKLLDAAAKLVGVPVEAVDSCGMLPLRAAPKTYSAAYHFRRFLHKELPAHLSEPPTADPLERLGLERLEHLPSAVTDRWKPTPRAALAEADALRALPIDHSVGPTGWSGGISAARGRLRRFVESDLPRYAEDRNHPDLDVASGLSPWLHFGHIAPHEIFRTIADAEGWSPMRLSEEADGRRRGWWGMSEAAEAFSRPARHVA